MARIEFKPSYNGAGNGIKFPGGGDVSAALQTLQDPSDNNLPFALSTSLFAVNGAAGLGSLSVKSNGVIPAVYLERTDGSLLISVAQSVSGSIIDLNGISFDANTRTFSVSSTLGNVTGSVGTVPVFQYTHSTDVSTNSVSNFFRLKKSIEPGAGEADFNNLIVEYSVNASGLQTGVLTGILINATETNLNGLTHNLVDLKVGGATQFKVSNSGYITSGSLSAGILSTARPFKVGDRASITEAGLLALGLDIQIAIEHNGNIYYMPVSSSLIP